MSEPSFDLVWRWYCNEPRCTAHAVGFETHESAVVDYDEHFDEDHAAVSR